jgi:hypothetical protein
MAVVHCCICAWHVLTIVRMQDSIVAGAGGARLSAEEEVDEAT